MRTAHRRKSTFYFTSGQVTVGFCKEVQEVPINYLPAARANSVYDNPQAYNYACHPVIPQGPYYGPPHQPRPAIAYQQAPLIAYPPATQAAYHQPPSPYLPVPQQQPRGSDQGSNRGPPPSAASTPYINTDAIQGWAYGVDQSNNLSPGLVRPDMQSVGSSSHRSKKRDARDRRRHDRKSRRRSVYSSSYDSRSDCYDCRSDYGFQADMPRPEPQPRVHRRGSTIQEPVPRRSYHIYVARGR